MNDLAPASQRPAAAKSIGRPAPCGITLWLLVSAMMSAGGWLLSAVHQLNAKGYFVLVGVELFIVLLWQKSRRFSDFQMAPWRRLIRRFRQPLPLGFLLLALLSGAGGVLYAPVSYDALAYRVPRVLHWLAENHWHWVHTAFPRLNVRACGQEWLMAPLLALTRSTRGFFAPCWISYLLLPGLCFSFFTRFGIPRRVAWRWMWIMATGYGYVTQSGSIANDILGVTYALAAFDFALRFNQSRSVSDCGWFLLAAALLTGSKASNLPLLLPLLVILLPCWREMLTHKFKIFGLSIFAALASFLPTAIMNLVYCHDWSGMRLEGPMRSPAQQLPFNILIWLIQNLTPPLFPFAAGWHHLLTRLFTRDVQLVHYFQMEELQTEEGAGIGVGIVLLLLVSLIARRFIFKKRNQAELSLRDTAPIFPRKLFIWALYVCLLAFGLKAQVVVSSARLLLPYYAILIAPFLLLFPAELLTRRWWRGLVAIVFAVAALMVVLAPARPLWPAQTILGALARSHPNSPLILRAKKVYAVYAARANGFAPLVSRLPADATVLGFITFDDPETSLWWPLGQRRVEHVLVTDDRNYLEQKGIRYLLVSPNFDLGPHPLETLEKKYDAEDWLTVPLNLRAGQETIDWHVLRLRPASK